MRTNIGLVIFPAVFCLMLYGIQRMVDSVFTATSTDTCECNCAHMPPANRTTCEFSCEMKYLKMGRGQKMPCPVPNPTRWPSLVQLPETGNRCIMEGGMGVLDLSESDEPSIAVKMDVAVVQPMQGDVVPADQGLVRGWRHRCTPPVLNARVSQICKGLFAEQEATEASIAWTLGNGGAVHFWRDRWSGMERLCKLAPDIFRLANRRRGGWQTIIHRLTGCGSL
ncbi:hypothetical protein QJS10_CPB14g01262 [Acorus calamus]|uniref:Uncharacterized protein n=1 Tax=Acorus calamus TaxID=4465 RepID=A0AAV9DBD3_ACOCL|nr:hypothetical protein QJS10_CPB14g01262 [Acorus calamus]